MDRLRRNGIVMCLPLVMAALALWPAGASASAGASAAAAPVDAGSRYLALGDSVTFGYEEPSVSPAPNYADAASFLGYPELLGAELHLTVANASCPGETSSSLINPSAPSNGCESSYKAPKAGYRRSYPLHMAYKGSQLAFALHYLRAHRNVRLVSLMIGANDGFLCIESTKDSCTSASEMAALKRTISGNVHHILHAIRQQANYRGQLAIVNYYSPFASYDPHSLLLNGIVDGAAKPFHVVIANGYAEFRAADRHSGYSACTAGLLTQLGKPGSCGIHPSYAGQSLLAQALEKAIRIG